MQLKKVMLKLDQIVVENGRRAGDFKLCVRVHRPGALGGTPVVNVADFECLEVKSVDKGFDWDSSKVIITLESDVCAITPEQRDEMSRSASRGTIQEYDKFRGMKQKIQELQALLELTMPSHDAWLAENGTDEQKAQYANALVEAQKPYR